MDELDELLDRLLEAVTDVDDVDTGEVDAPGVELAAHFADTAAQLPTTTTELRHLRRRLRMASRRAERLTMTYSALVVEMAAVRDAVAEIRKD